MSYHRITVIGYVGSEPEHRVTATGKDFTYFPVYVNERYGDGEKVTRYKVKTWNNLALMVKDHVCTGQLLVVDGTPSVDAWRNAEGKPCAQMVVTAQALRFLGAKPEMTEDDTSSVDSDDEY